MQNERLKLELPFPASELSPNKAHGQHWSKTSKLKKIAKLSAYMLTKSHLKSWKPTGGNIPLKVTFVMPDRIKRDKDNLLAACKSMLDGVALALRIDDSQFNPITVETSEVSSIAKTIIEIG